MPTGPRNQNKYKDRDNNAQAVDGLDYGGGGFGAVDRGSVTPGVEFDDRNGRYVERVCFSSIQNLRADFYAQEAERPFTERRSTGTEKALTVE